MTPSKSDPRIRQVVGGVVVISLVSLFIILLWLGRAVPGLFGEWLGIVAGMASTPFLMEASFVVLGFMIVFALNGWRQYREGDELVYLEQVEGPEAETLPEDARFAIYQDAPADVPVLADIDAIEGALEAGDRQLAAELLGELEQDRLTEPAVMDLRIRLAEASGQQELADQLRARRKH
jgi:hypothetical protein